MMSCLSFIWVVWLSQRVEHTAGRKDYVTTPRITFKGFAPRYLMFLINGDSLSSNMQYLLRTHSCTLQVLAACLPASASNCIPVRNFPCQSLHSHPSITLHKYLASKKSYNTHVLKLSWTITSSAWPDQICFVLFSLPSQRKFSENECYLSKQLNLSTHQRWSLHAVYITAE